MSDANTTVEYVTGEEGQPVENFRLRFTITSPLTGERYRKEVIVNDLDGRGDTYAVLAAGGALVSAAGEDVLNELVNTVLAQLPAEDDFDEEEQD